MHAPGSTCMLLAPNPCLNPAIPASQPATQPKSATCKIAFLVNNRSIFGQNQIYASSGCLWLVLGALGYSASFRMLWDARAGGNYKVPSPCEAKRKPYSLKTLNPKP